MSQEKVPFEFSLASTNPDAQLGFEVRLDGVSIYRNEHVATPERFQKFIDDTDGKHVLEFELFGKQVKDTIVDETGKIIEDAVLELSNITLDEIDIKIVMYDNAEYTHNFNGTGETVTQKFFGSMGCNGIVRLEFTTPVYLWFLEKM